MSFLGFLKQSTAVDVKIGPFVDSGDGDAEETGLTIAASDVILSKNGQTGGAKNDDTAAAHAEDGMYNCEFDATDTDTVGQLTLGVHVAGALFVRHDFQVLEEAVYDRDYAASATGVDADWTNAGRLDTLLDAIPTTAMRGTDNAALASVLGALNDAAAVDDPTSADTAMQYLKQLINIIIGTTGVGTMPSGADPANGINLFEMLRAAMGATFATATDSLEQLQADHTTAQSDLDIITGASGVVLANDSITSSIIAANAIGDSELAADAFDGAFVRDIDQVEASAPLHSLATAILKAVSRVRDNAGTLEVFRTDGTTVHMSQTVTADATLDPVDELTAGV